MNSIDAVHNVLLDYCRFVDEAQAEAVTDLFAPTGELIEGRTYSGREEICTYLKKVLSQLSATSHHLTNVKINIGSNNQATATSYVYMPGTVDLMAPTLRSGGAMRTISGQPTSIGRSNVG